MRALPPAILAMAALAGCMGAGPAPTGSSAATAEPPGQGLQESFDSWQSIPATWSADAGTWSLVANATAPSAPNVLVGTGGGTRSTLRAPGAYLDFEANVTFRMTAGDEGAGLSFRYAPDGTYGIVRFSVRETGWHYFSMGEGRPGKVDEAAVLHDAPLPALGDLVHLRVRVQGHHVQAWQGETLVLAYEDPSPPQAGQVGPFLRGSMSAQFDDLRVAPL